MSRLVRSTPQGFSRDNPLGTFGKPVHEIPTDTAGKKLFVHPPTSDNQGAKIALLKFIQHCLADPEQTLADLEVNLTFSNSCLIESFFCMGEKLVDAFFVSFSNDFLERFGLIFLEVDRTKIFQLGRHMKK